MGTSVFENMYSKLPCIKTVNYNFELNDRIKKGLNGSRVKVNVKTLARSSPNLYKYIQLVLKPAF